MKAKIRLFLRGIYRLVHGLNGFAYDYRRYVFHGGWRENLGDKDSRNYSIMMAYHGLEKSLSYKNRNPNSGWSNAERVLQRLRVANRTGEIGFHDMGGKDALTRFLNLPENVEKERAQQMLTELEKMDFKTDEIHGAIPINEETFKKGVLSNPEDFFLTRHSLREFKDQVVDEELIRRAIKLATRTPSVCNRQMWHVYHSDQRQIIDKTLSYQNGNRPFGKKVPNVLVIATDLKAFFAGAEHYQHWIDGGLFSMSLMYAFHSLGLASCPLNWCQTPKNDRALRKAIDIKPNHTVIMMMAVGYPDNTNKVCSSARKPISDFYTQITLR